MSASGVGTSVARSAPGGGAGVAAGGGVGGSRRFTREDVLRLGQAGSAWEFAPVAVAALRAAPGDGAVRFLFAAALGRLGLRTLAIEQLGLVTGEGAKDPAVGQLRSALSELPADEVTAAERVRLVRGNVDALGDRGADLRCAVEAWGARVEGVQAYRTGDGNVVRRVKGEMDPGRWVHLADHAGTARAFVAQHITVGVAGKAAAPVTLEGVDPPWLLRELARAMRADATAFQARLVVLQADVMEALDGLSLVDLRAELAEERVMALAGMDAGVRLGAWARANLGKRLTGAYVPLIGVRTRLEPGAQGEMAGALKEQERVAAEIKARVHARDAGRSAGYWAERFGGEGFTTETRRHGEGREGFTTEAQRRRGGRGESGEERGGARGASALRILIPTCRYTTFLRHAAADLAEALTRLGHRAEVLMEVDGHSQMSSVAYLEAMERVDPDLIVFLNYTRAQMAGLLPAGQPAVCWVQDMMPHLFTAESGASQGPMDFIAGHCGDELFTRYGYSRERAIACPVVASERKFHTGAVSDELRERFACEIACVTHHSETVESMHERLKRESAKDPDAAGAMEELLPVCVEVAARSQDLNVWSTLRSEVKRVLARRHRHAGNADVEGAFFRNYAMPVADRAFRHQGIAWAVRVAERRGWRLRLYGKGWEKHPEWARFAGGLTQHGEELRACYQSAAVQLHLCISSLTHQRCMECALSGGLPVMRATRDAVSGLSARAKRACIENGAEAMGAHEATGLPLVSFADSVEGMQYASMLQRLGMEVKAPGIVLQRERAAGLGKRGGLDPIENDPAWLYGDLPEICFRDEAELERLVERAMEGRGWREAVAEGIAGRVRERLTHVRLARRMLGAVAARARELAELERAGLAKTRELASVGAAAPSAVVAEP